MIRKERIFDRTPDRNPDGNIVYWMSREQRVADNPGLLYALQLAQEAGKKLHVVFALTGEFPGAALRHYDFMLNGLSEVAAGLTKRNIPFRLLTGDPPVVMAEFIEASETGTVVVDFDPLRVKQTWFDEAARLSDAKFVEVDGHNIVPARFVSDKLEYAAYTIRPKINRNLEKFLEVFPDPQWSGPGLKQESFRGDAQREPGTSTFSIQKLLEELQPDPAVKPVDWIRPGEQAAQEKLAEFINDRLPDYAEGRNDPNKQVTSDLSPYLHFGQISAGRVAHEVIASHPDDEQRKAFLEELIVRKELSDNFCLYNPDYDHPGGFHDWAKKTIAEHREDAREYLYSTEEFEKGKTHDPLWNAAQMEMVKRGKMHGYMRMYWAKKILEWTESVEVAMETAIMLNDRYELDGRDPNGYAGIAWSIGGVHDRAWNERKVFGKIRYMNDNGARRKFDTKAYIKYTNEL